MEIVAQHLVDQALQRNTGDGRDLFGRSAFNRFYYASFLKAQSTLRSHRPQWANHGHSKLPRIFKDDVVNELKIGLSRGKKTGDTEVMKICADAISAARGLASILEEGYATRVTADYFPDVAIEFTSSRDFKLNAVSVAKAHNWPAKASGFVSTLEKAWRQLNAQ